MMYLPSGIPKSRLLQVSQVGDGQRLSLWFVIIATTCRNLITIVVTIVVPVALRIPPPGLIELNCEFNLFWVPQILPYINGFLEY